MNRYRVAGRNGRSTVVASNDRPMSVPTTLRRYVMAVTGLNSTMPKAMHVTPRARSSAAGTGPQCSTYWGEHTAAVKPAFHGVTSLPTVNCGYSAAQLRAAYGLTGSDVGRGQRVALIELGTPYKMFKTLLRYAQVNGLPAPSSTQYQELAIGQGAACGNFFDIEEQLDSESVYAMAPAANQLLVGGDTCNEQLGGVQALYDAETAVLNGNGKAPLASIESNSWGLTGGEIFPVIYQTTAHAILLRAAAEGVTMAFSSGDNPGVSVPASDPYALSVGAPRWPGPEQPAPVRDRLVERRRVPRKGALARRGHRARRRGWRDEPDLGTAEVSAGRRAAFDESRGHRRQPHRSCCAGPLGRRRRDDRHRADRRRAHPQGRRLPQLRRRRHEPGGSAGRGHPGRRATGPQRFGFVNPTLYALAKTAAFHDALPVTSASPALERGAYCPKALCGDPSVSLFDSQLPAYTDR